MKEPRMDYLGNYYCPDCGRELYKDDDGLECGECDYQIALEDMGGDYD